jgi:hypothetical protein
MAEASPNSDANRSQTMAFRPERWRWRQKREAAMIDLVWSPGLPHWTCWLGQRLPNVPGLYRIRRVGRDDLDYIGQTGAGGMTLKKRMGMLRGIYAEVMPYRDPHTESFAEILRKTSQPPTCGMIWLSPPISAQGDGYGISHSTIIPAC